MLQECPSYSTHAQCWCLSLLQKSKHFSVWCIFQQVALQRSNTGNHWLVCFGPKKAEIDYDVAEEAVRCQEFFQKRLFMAWERKWIYSHLSHRVLFRTVTKLEVCWTRIALVVSAGRACGLAISTNPRCPDAGVSQKPQSSTLKLSLWSNRFHWGPVDRHIIETGNSVGNFRLISMRGFSEKQLSQFKLDIQPLVGV